MKKICIGCFKDISRRANRCRSCATKGNKINAGRIRIDMRGENNPNWNGGVSTTQQGYLFNNQVKLLVHRIIWETNNGKIPPKLIIHHINRDKKDNRLENLVLTTRAEHMRLHDPMNWKNHIKNSQKKCLNCDKIVHSKDLCSGHYIQEFRRRNKTLNA